jgi:hypothetical protein
VVVEPLNLAVDHPDDALITSKLLKIINKDSSWGLDTPISAP